MGEFLALLKSMEGGAWISAHYRFIKCSNGLKGSFYNSLSPSTTLTFTTAGMAGFTSLSWPESEFDNYTLPKVSSSSYLVLLR